MLKPLSVAVCAVLGAAAPALAQPEATPTVAAQPAAAASGPAAPAVPPAPYSLPWQLRPAQAVSVVRSDTAIPFYEDAMGNGGTTVVSTLLASYKVTPAFAPLLRLAFVSSSPPTGAGSTVVANPVVGGTYGLKLSEDLRLALFLGLAIPVGQGGGDTPDAGDAASMKAAIPARSAMDNAMFAANYLTPFPGASLAFVRSGFTAQVEVTFLELIRVRGGAVEKDDARTNFTTGLHLGYFVIPQLSLGGELRYQRWLSTPAAVAADATGATRDNLTFAVGPRAHFKVGPLWLRPGLAYAQAIDDPMGQGSYRILQLDIPILF